MYRKKMTWHKINPKNKASVKEIKIIYEFTFTF